MADSTSRWAGPCARCPVAWKRCRARKATRPICPRALLASTSAHGETLGKSARGRHHRHRRRSPPGGDISGRSQGHAHRQGVLGPVGVAGVQAALPAIDWLTSYSLIRPPCRWFSNNISPVGRAARPHDAAAADGSGAGRNRPPGRHRRACYPTVSSWKRPVRCAKTICIRMHSTRSIHIHRCASSWHAAPDTALGRTGRKRPSPPAWRSKLMNMPVREEIARLRRTGRPVRSALCRGQRTSEAQMSALYDGKGDEHCLRYRTIKERGPADAGGRRQRRP